jgi:hypothetical protein
MSSCHCSQDWHQQKRIVSTPKKTIIEGALWRGNRRWDWQIQLAGCSPMEVSWPQQYVPHCRSSIATRGPQLCTLPTP